MNLITDTWRGLVRRKLWPVALLLVGALVAVPLTLAQEPEVTPAPANAANAAGDEGLPATFVSAADAASGEEGDGKRRRTLGVVKDPFEPAPVSKKDRKKKQQAAAKKAADGKPAKGPAAKSEATPPAGKPSAPSGGGGGGALAPSAPPAAAAPTATPAPKVPLHSIRVRFGRTEAGEQPARTVERLQVLPDEEHPVLVYRGVERGGKVAVFELTGSVVTEGDGACEPTPQDCQYLKLRAGETQFITVGDTGEATDAQYQLDLIRITTKSTASHAKLAKASKAGKSVLRSLKRKSGYAFDASSGTLRKLKRATRDATL